MRLHEMDFTKKIRRKSWINFIFYIVASDKLYKTVEGKNYLFTKNDIVADDWEYFEEPKKKVTKYLWAYTRAHHNDTLITLNFYKNIEEFRTFYFGDDIFKNPQRLDWSATEFEE